MSLSINNSTASGANYNEAALSSLKYNGDEVLDPWVEYTFPNSSAKLTGSGNNALGFGLSGGSASGSSQRYYALNNVSNNAWTVTDSSTSLYILLPDLLAPVKVLYVKNSYNSYGSETLSILSSRSVDSSADWIKILDSPRSKGDDIPDEYNNLDCASIKISATRKSGASTITVGNFYFKFKVRKSKLNAWKARYNLS